MTRRQWLVFSALVVTSSAAIAPAFADSRCFPSTRFVVVDGGLVRDTLTRLVWQQQPSATPMSYTDAQTFCSSNGFRVPTIKELYSLVDLRPISPTIDLTAFPDTPAASFWTSTSYRTSPTDTMWTLNFYSGNSGSQLKTQTLYVRCVR